MANHLFKDIAEAWNTELARRWKCSLIAVGTLLIVGPVIAVLVWWPQADGDKVDAALATLAAVSSALTLLTVIVGGVIAYRQLLSGREQARQAQVAAQVPIVLGRLDRLIDLRAKQKLLYETYSKQPEILRKWKEVPEATKEACEDIVRELGEIGILLQSGLTQWSFLKERVGMIAAKCGMSLREYIKDREHYIGGHHLAIKLMTLRGLEYWEDIESRRGTRPEDRALRIWNDTKTPNKEIEEYRRELVDELMRWGWIDGGNV